jgi:hypothetical protein
MTMTLLAFHLPHLDPHAVPSICIMQYPVYTAWCSSTMQVQLQALQDADGVEGTQYVLNK